MKVNTLMPGFFKEHPAIALHYVQHCITCTKCKVEHDQLELSEKFLFGFFCQSQNIFLTWCLVHGIQRGPLGNGKQ